MVSFQKILDSLEEYWLVIFIKSRKLVSEIRKYIFSKKLGVRRIIGILNFWFVTARHVKWTHRQGPIVMKANANVTYMLGRKSENMQAQVVANDP